ncbi:condensin-2 complex subunit G2-like isoform X2 [Vespa crabro]|uniref:condensin-2 complex subunit G2-like isoform X2 n=2 Tax=Vespa crabro TaxID=7445 RepID=UPI001F012475|nr:condensin-2 complex subunit G2-like isoform X2 [Vespa crabro]
MSCQRVIIDDKLLFRILKTKGYDISTICDKMKLDAKNIIVLSEEELCELWYHVKVVLLKAQKLSILQSNNKNSKEKQQALKLIETIAAMALETVLQRTFLPNILLEIVIILHSVILPEMKDTKVKDEISYLLENWWKSNMIWKEKVIINAIKHLTETSESSLQHIKRLHKIRSALYLIERNDDIQMLVELSRSSIVMSIPEGRVILLKLFALGEEFVMGIHNNVKAMLEIAEPDVIKGYANLYAKAWLSATNKTKKLIIEKCFRNIIFHCLRSRRDSTGRVKLGTNLLIFIDALYHYKSNTIRVMLHDHFKSLLWEHLKASGSCVRCNAADILFIIYSVESKHLTQNENDMKQYSKAISYLLKDSNEQVCLIAINGTFKILESHWKHIPANIIKNWLNILSCHMKSKSSSEIKISILNGIKQMVSNKHSRTSVKSFINNFVNQIYYADIDVIKCFTKLIVYLQNHSGILVWDIVALTTLLKCIEDTNESKLLQQLIKLLCLRIQPHDINNDNATQEIINIGMKNITATRKFFFHSKYIINWDNASKLINIILLTIERQACCLLADDETSNKCSKRFKRNNDKSHNANSTKDIIKQEINTCESINILLEVVAVILYVNKNNVTKEYFDKEEGRDLRRICTSILPQILCSYRIQKLSLNESTLFLLSFLPVTMITNANNICETIVEQLSNRNISNEMIITILYTLMKWEKMDIVFTLLKELITKFTNTTIEYNQENSNDLFIKEQEKTLILTVEILKQLLNIDFQEKLLTIYYEDLVNACKELRVIQYHMENRLTRSNELSNIMKEQVLIGLFKDYLSMIYILLKIDVYDISECLQDILSWVEEKVIPKMPTMEEHKKHQFPINILKIVFNVCNSMIKECQLSTKICCKIIILYFKSISSSVGIIFIHDALKAIIALLHFNKTQYYNEDSNLLNTILPKFLCAAMISLNEYSEDNIIAYTNNLKILTLLIEKYFETIVSTYDDQKMHATYLTIVLNTGINDISKEIIDNTRNNSADILKIKFPYLAEKILKNTLYLRKYQDACFFAIKQAVIHYNEVDILSTLLIINDMFNLPIKSMKKLRNITHVIKLEYEKRCDLTVHNRFIVDAIETIIKLIQKIEILYLIDMKAFVCKILMKDNLQWHILLLYFDINNFSLECNILF